MFSVRNLNSANMAIHTDSIVVLTGGAHRIDTGLDLLHDGLAKHLFISGVDSRVTVEKLISLWNRENKSDIPCCITLGHDAHNTRQNADEVKRWVEKENIDSIRLVTASYHMPRALLELKEIMPEKKIVMHPVTSSKDSSDDNSLPLSFEEYNKTLLTWLRIRLLR